MAQLGAILLFALFAPQAPSGDELPGTRRLEGPEDLSARMMEGLHRFVERKIDQSVESREKLWARDSSSPAAYQRSVDPNRRRFMKIIGAVDPRVSSKLQIVADYGRFSQVASEKGYDISQVRWPVLEGVTGEGLLLSPRETVRAYVIALPDAGHTPEQLAGLAPGVPSSAQFARRMAENGVRVIVPALINRDFEFSGNPAVAMTNQSHREWVYRQAFQMGRHVIGYEVQKVLAAVDAIRKMAPDARIGVAGYGEGGLLALYSAAVDPRIDAAFVSGYFDSRQRAWQEPLYRNVWSILREFGDAEIASLIAPRPLVVEYSPGPKVDGPTPPPRGRRRGAAVGKLGTPAWKSVRAEFERIGKLVRRRLQERHLVAGEGGTPVGPGSPEALRQFAQLLGVASDMAISGRAPHDLRRGFDPRERQRRQVKELVDRVQHMLRTADRVRNARLLDQTTLMKTLESRGARFRMYRVKTRSPETFAEEMKKHRKEFWEEILGKFHDPTLEPNPRSRKLTDREKWVGYDVTLEVFPDVFAWGTLLVPKDLKPGEKRPVVVCQHGRNGLPKDSLDENSAYYRGFAARLADRGFVVFAPHNPYRGEDLYRMLDRKANLVKGTLFSFILAQHQQILTWLKTLPYVDGDRIGFYGLSYGGETAVRVPPILTGYALSICSGDFNDWARKVASTESSYSFMFSIEWEMPYFNLGSTFNYAEMAYLMVPRPFMVERGHHDGVAPDEWVSYEYAKVKWLYTQLGLGDRTAIEFYNGGHVINREGTFDFLHRHLKWPRR